MKILLSTLQKIFELSDIYADDSSCQSADDMQNNLEKINDLLRTEFHIETLKTQNTEV